MPRFFTHYWTNNTRDEQQIANQDGDQCDHTAGNGFKKRKTAPGDFVFVITVKKGQLYVLSRMKVKDVVEQEEADNILGQDLWEARDHVIAESSSPMDFQRKIPTEVTEKLLFIAPGGYKSPVFKKPGYLDQQTMRGIRELDTQSAELLSRYL